MRVPVRRELTMTKAKRNRGDSPKERMLKAAGTLFAEKGFSRTTVRDYSDDGRRGQPNSPPRSQGHDRLARPLPPGGAGPQHPGPCRVAARGCPSRTRSRSAPGRRRPVSSSSRGPPGAWRTAAGTRAALWVRARGQGTAADTGMMCRPRVLTLARDGGSMPYSGGGLVETGSCGPRQPSHGSGSDRH